MKKHKIAIFTSLRMIPAHPRLMMEKEILIDDDQEFRIKLTLVPTYDFEREILSKGSSFKIISPESFKNHMKAEIEVMLKNFN